MCGKCGEKKLEIWSPLDHSKELFFQTPQTVNQKSCSSPGWGLNQSEVFLFHFYYININSTTQVLYLLHIVWFMGAPNQSMQFDCCIIKPLTTTSMTKLWGLIRVKLQHFPELWHINTSTLTLVFSEGPVQNDMHISIQTPQRPVLGRDRFSVHLSQPVTLGLCPFFSVGALRFKF